MEENIHYILCIDLGSSAVKVCLMTRDESNGHVDIKGYAKGFYETSTPRVNYIEQDPNEWWEATKTACAELWRNVGPEFNRECFAISVTGQMQDVVLVNIEEGVVRPAILYSDSRSIEEAKYLEETVGADYMQKVTRNYKGASGILPKLLWLKNNESESMKKADLVLLGAHDFIIWKLCGAHVTDFTNASTTGLLDVEESTWAWELLEKAQLASMANYLPKLHRFKEGAVGDLCLEAKEALGLENHALCFHSGGDLAAVTIGALGLEVGEEFTQYIYLGTSGWIAATQKGYHIPKADDECFTLLHPDPQFCIRAASMATAFGNLEWLSDIFSDTKLIKLGNRLGMEMADKYSMINDFAGKADIGSGGLMFLPYLCGERSPFRDPLARASFIGLSRGTSKSCMYRAVFEGIAFATRTLKNCLLLPFKEYIVLVGGGGKSPVFCQILADVLKVAVVVPSNSEFVGSIGSARTAKLPLKRKKSVFKSEMKNDNGAPQAEEKDVTLPFGTDENLHKTYQPNEYNCHVYDRLYEVLHNLLLKLLGAQSQEFHQRFMPSEAIKVHCKV
eukprot:Nk52_evm87s352 gene=Nk52_evmTU87s352